MNAKTLMLVEDDDVTRYLIHRELVAAELIVVDFSDTMDAWRAISDGRQRYDLLLVDICFPTGQPHGVALARHSQRKHPSIPILVMSAYPELLATARDAGFSTLTKPIQMEVIRDAVIAELTRLNG